MRFGRTNNLAVPHFLSRQAGPLVPSRNGKVLFPSHRTYIRCRGTSSGIISLMFDDHSVVPPWSRSDCHHCDGRRIGASDAGNRGSGRGWVYRRRGGSRRRCTSDHKIPPGRSAFYRCPDAGVDGWSRIGAPRPASLAPGCGPDCIGKQQPCFNRAALRKPVFAQAGTLPTSCSLTSASLPLPASQFMLVRAANARHGEQSPALR